MPVGVLIAKRRSCLELERPCRIAWMQYIRGNMKRKVIIIEEYVAVMLPGCDAVDVDTRHASRIACTGQVRKIYRIQHEKKKKVWSACLLSIRVVVFGCCLQERAAAYAGQLRTRVRYSSTRGQKKLESERVCPRSTAQVKKL